MDFLLSVLTVIFIALMLGAAVTFGFVLLVWFIGVAMALSAVMIARRWWLRWRFMHSAERPRVIEAEYEEISGEE